MRIPCCAVALLVLWQASLGWTQSSSYPARPVRIVVPIAPGGGVDFIARVVAQKLGESLKQSFQVENRVGASGMIGTGFVAKAVADGYTLMVGSQTTHAVIPALYARQVPYDGIRDFTPVTVLASAPLVFVVNPSLPVRSVRDFIALARKRPGELAFGATSGGTTHMSVERFRLAAGVSVLFVPYKGEAPALTDTMRGELSFQFANLPVAMPHTRSGRLRAIAVTSPNRLPSLQALPTVAESGLPGFEHATWWGLFGPAGLPRGIVQRLHDEVSRALLDPATREKLEGLGVFPVGSTPEQFAAMLNTEVARWAGVVRDSGIKPE